MTESIVAGDEMPLIASPLRGGSGTQLPGARILCVAIEKLLTFAERDDRKLTKSWCSKGTEHNLLCVHVVLLFINQLNYQY